MTIISRVLTTHHIKGARLVRRHANFHEFAPPEGLSLAPGETWRFTVEGMIRAPSHRNEGVRTAWVTLGGRHIPVQVGDLTHGTEAPPPAPPRLPEGRLTLPFAVLPWPNAIEATPGEMPILIHAAAGTGRADLRLMMTVAALHRRLFPAARAVFQPGAVPGSRALAFAEGNTGPEGYRLDFGDTITLTAATETGRRHGLITLAQMLHGAATDPAFRFPATGRIEDAPRHGWRGCHLDVSRHFWTVDEVTRLIDILAWHRMNVFHWHLTDDEGWRAEIRAFPSLTATGAHRDADSRAMPPQLGDGPDRSGGFYTQDQMRGVVAHAGALGIEVMPEIEMPGHAACVVAALPSLVDPEEPAESYRPVQGYPNNGWNPGMEATFSVLETIFDELADIFPSRHVHIGGDEVAKDAWLASPAARAVMEREGLAGTFELQSWFLRRVKAMLDARGKVLVGWNEVAHGGGVPPEGTLLMAWERPEVGIDLAGRGYDVVMTPGQAYYLDMAQGPGWMENGASWAGASPPEVTYAYEAAGDFPADLAGRLRGVQCCIWCEHYSGRAWFNDLVFPRLSAVAEAAWTKADNKDWLRFVAQSRGMPRL